MPPEKHDHSTGGLAVLTYPEAMHDVTFGVTVPAGHPVTLAVTLVV